MPQSQSAASCGIPLNFNLQLLELEPELWDYVIVHELLHFSVPNHGKLWKSLMRAHLGDWEACERRINDLGVVRDRARI